MSESQLLTHGQAIVAGMTANFATAPDLPALVLKLEAYSTALVNAMQGSLADKAAKDEAKAALIDELHHVGDWIVYTCNGDRVKAITSGFSINKEENSSVAVITPALGQKLADGSNKGELKYSFKKVPGATGYIYQITPDPITADSVWTEKVGTTRKVSFASLQSGKRYWCRVQAIGKNGQCVSSDPISRISQ